MRFKNSPQIIVAVAMALPVGSFAQTQLPAPADSAPADSAQRNGTGASKKHLDDAAAVLQGVSDSRLKGDGKEKVAELRTNFDKLVAAYTMNPDGFGSPALSGALDSSEDESEVLNWKIAFTEVENDLANILGGWQAPDAPTLPTAPLPITPGETSDSARDAVVGTSGAAVSPADAVPTNTTGARESTAVDSAKGAGAEPGSAPSPTGVGTSGSVGVPQTAQPGATGGAGLVAGAMGVKDLDPTVRTQLQQFRLQVELFFAATTMNLEGETAR